MYGIELVTAGKQTLATLKFVLDELGYTNDSAYVTADNFGEVRGCVHTLISASRIMSVSGVFGLWSRGFNKTQANKFKPIAYVAVAENHERAQEIHRAVWNQGVAAFLVIVGPERVWLCNGFRYSPDNWLGQARRYNVRSGKIVEQSSSSSLAFELEELKAFKIKYGLGWQDAAKESDDYIDKNLLKSLADLSAYFQNGDAGRNLTPLDARATSALIGRLLYVYMLYDRGVLTPSGLEALGVNEESIRSCGHWAVEDFWKFIKKLDQRLNGSVFPMMKELVDEVGQEHFDTLRSIIRNGASFCVGGSLQTSFFGYEFAVIKTETLSAIYELFLQMEAPDEKREKGAYYTPPFLVDYVLDRVEEQLGSLEGKTIYDPAAGSGVFLVAAFRRMIEGRISATKSSMTLADLHALMKKHIFACEQNATACQVAAFSLYLTMLDYLPLEDFDIGSTQKSSFKLFPAMIPSNIKPFDFFDDKRNSFDVVLGNPPWTSPGKLGSQAAIEFGRFLGEKHPVDGKQAAHLFFWKGLMQHLKSDGLMALLMPSNVLSQHNCRNFRDAISKNYRLIGAADLSHLRYHLFRGVGAQRPRASACCLFVKNTAPSEEQYTWIYKPSLTSIPLLSHKDVWLLNQDWEAASWAKQTDLLEAAEGWAPYLNMGQMDRQIIWPLRGRLRDGLALSLGEFFAKCGIQDLQGKSASAWGVTEENIVDKPLSRNGLQTDLLEAKRNFVQVGRSGTLSRHPYFGVDGMVVLSRSLDFVNYYTTRDRLFSGSYILYAFENSEISKKRLTLILRGLEKFFNSEVFGYLVKSLDGRYLRDRKQVSQVTINSIISPFNDFNDDLFEALSRVTSKEKIENIFCNRLGLFAEERAVIRNFTEYKQLFSDGAVPGKAKRQVSQKTLGLYVEELQSRLSGPDAQFDVKVILQDQTPCYVVTLPSKAIQARAPEDAVHWAIEKLRTGHGDQYNSSRFIVDDPDHMQSVVIKPPMEYFWSVDKAYDDALRLEALYMGGG